MCEIDYDTYVETVKDRLLYLIDKASEWYAELELAQRQFERAYPYNPWAYPLEVRYVFEKKIRQALADIEEISEEYANLGEQEEVQ